MKINSFQIHLYARILALMVSIFAFAFLYFQAIYFYTLVMIGIGIGIQVFFLVRFVEYSNREMTKLLDNIRYDDFSNTYLPLYKDSAFETLNSAMNQAIQHFKAIRNEKEAHYQFVLAILHNIDIGIIVFSKKGEIALLNNAAKKILRIETANTLQDIEEISEEIHEKIISIKTGQRITERFSIKNEPEELVLTAIEASLMGETHRLITIQNIISELEAKEMDAWRGLVRILTHEIMNSVSPISSLANILQEELRFMHEEKGNEDEFLSDLIKAADTIKRRTESLISFVSEFRNLAQIPVPKLAYLPVHKLMEHVAYLMKTEIEKAQINFVVEIPPPSFYITADEVLIEQVLINLLKNAIQAIIDNENQYERGEIYFASQLDEKSRLSIHIRDNGKGIAPEALEKIFIPFYTTKKNGSGIGLSLSKEIMRKHKGSLTVESEMNKGSSFTLRFG